MHLIPTTPGGWMPNNEGVFYIDQKPGDIVFLSAADTEISSVNTCYKQLVSLENPSTSSIPSIRLSNLNYLKQELSIDTYCEEVISKSKLVICRMLGGRAYYPYLFEQLCTVCENNKIPLLLLPGYNVPDVELLNSSTADTAIFTTLWNYFNFGGNVNISNGLKFVFAKFFGLNYDYDQPKALPDIFLWDHEIGIVNSSQAFDDPSLPHVALIAYQAHYTSNNLDPINFISKSIKAQHWNLSVIFANQLRDKNIISELSQLINSRSHGKLNVIINTTSFSIKSLHETDEEEFIFDQLKVPVIQAIFAGSTKESWETNFFGLTPTDVAINVALPEIDGRIITKAISFKSSQGKDITTDSETIQYKTHEEGCDFVVDFCKNWIKLQNKANPDKRVALVMPNYPNKDSRLANGVGLDTPESCVNILKALKNTGYTVGNEIPNSSKELIEKITKYISNDLDTQYFRPYQVAISKINFDKFYKNLSEDLRARVENQWGLPEDSPNFHNNEFIIPGFLQGHIFVSIQPSRGYSLDAKAIYHSPDLPPTFAYLAYYFWVSHVFGADAIIHLGKHGNLEWLPGKSLALSEKSCFPAALLGPIPHFYPFIINDPGEGTQAKRRNHAVIIDHLIPAMTRAETYGPLTKLEHLIDEYYESYNIDIKRANHIKKNIQTLTKEINLHVDLGIQMNDIDELLVKLDGYLCEIKESQIRDGLHILGDVPVGEQLVDLIISMHRLPSFGGKGITQAIATDIHLQFDPIKCDYATSYDQILNETYCRTYGDVIEQLEKIAKIKVEILINNYNSNNRCQAIDSTFHQKNTKHLLEQILTDTLPKLHQTKNEILNLLQGLNGKYISSGASGAPTRGNLHVLPTGRNFYSVDVRTIPTETAYTLGLRSSELIIDRYLQENGDYPETIGLSVWGTSTMRTGGDDIAQAFALMGVRPIWQNANRRVSDFEILSLLNLKRPRIDVTLRISGFFRDAFPDVIAMYNAAVERLAQLDEPWEQNPIKKKFDLEKKQWIEKGITEENAHKRSLYRIFGSKPGAYGTGLQALIDEKNWNSREDLAKVYINWGGYAYGSDRKGVSAHEVFEKRLSDIQLVMHNQDNREHDILDSDDYYQFQGGMANAIESANGEAPSIYFGDHARPENPKIKSLKEELLKVYRSRVVNPKWIKGMQRHGYKGAFEMAATMDYLFAYDATTNLIEDFMYEGITQEYLFNEENQKFLETSNPWALKDMTERMLEAIQRGMWKNPTEATSEALKNLLINSEE